MRRHSLPGSLPHVPSKEVSAICQGLVLSDEYLRAIMNIFLAEVVKGLGKATHNKASVKCYNTYVQDMPTGKENGKFLSLDLGGSNFRVMVVRLKAKVVEMEFRTYGIPSEIIMHGTGEQLFDFIAKSLLDFCEAHQINPANHPLGFTFSFPVKQEGVAKGILQYWSKGFQCSGAEGRDVTEMLRNAFKRLGVPNINVTAVINDTTGTLMSCAWQNPTCKIGLVVGTGFNCCYIETIANVELFDGDKKKPHVIVNTECGAFGDNGELKNFRTMFDRSLDASSSRPGQHVAEKMISAMYLGEIVRLALLECIEQNIMFGGKASKLLKQEYSFFVDHVADIESDAEGSYIHVQKILFHFNMTHATEQDMIDTQYICACVLSRSASLVSAILATLVNKMAYAEVTVGADGTLYRTCARYRTLLEEKLEVLLDQRYKVKIVRAEDGGGKGAALVAAVAATAKR